MYVEFLVGVDLMLIDVEIRRADDSGRRKKKAGCFLSDMI